MARVDHIVNSPFLRNVATVSAGQMVAAAIPFLAAPILGRLYAPEDYGPFGVDCHMAVCTSYCDRKTRI